MHAPTWLRRGLLGVLAALPLWFAAATPSLAADSAVVLMYHRFGESAFPSTNIRLEQFDAHIAELSSGPYTVLPLPDIVAAIREGRELPDRAVAITIDDGYLSIYTEAWPRLRRAGFPFTVFLSTDPIDREFAGFMSWDQVRELKAAGVTIGGHTATHLHMAANSPARNESDIARSNARYLEELGEIPKIFAYPFGEASTRVQRIVQDAGYDVAFGQHSGALGASHDLYYLPRFALNENFGDMERFRLVVNSLPIPYSDMTPINPTLAENPPIFGFTRAPDAEQINGLACYAADQGQVQVDVIGPRVEVRMDRAFSNGWARINCTGLGRDGRWRWLGMLYYVPRS
ncbi:MAG: chitin deacetylase [Alphaproteobacteria bacterium]|nr:chitin deacetylase [Alphaproteobacteria bacterium]|tara:strand:- start:1447 stop:2481 length:1035 start_codon:yes stop_codon:yes gene_type:complete